MPDYPSYHRVSSRPGGAVLAEGSASKTTADGLEEEAEEINHHKDDEVEVRLQGGLVLSDDWDHQAQDTVDAGCREGGGYSYSYR